MGQDRDAIGFAAALLANPVQFGPTRDLLQLARLCLARHCRLRFRDHIWQPDDAIPLGSGSGLDFIAGRPADRVGEEDLIEPNAHTIDLVPEQPLPPAQPPLAAQPPFIRDLYEYWLDQATDGPGGIEQILRVQTWYLEGGYIRHNDECRMVVLGEEYWEWGRALQRRWIDLLYPDEDVDYVMATPAPPTASSPTVLFCLKGFGPLNVPALSRRTTMASSRGSPTLQQFCCRQQSPERRLFGRLASHFSAHRTCHLRRVPVFSKD